ncbi:MAG: hypothetical protein K2Z81_17530, partial [Cyanobacteria bacterium]|nr:hypothetical protein [Cyanobacteriota bacterium]
PEQCSGGHTTSYSDQYSLGCVIFEALTGSPPFRGDTAFDTMNAHLKEEPPAVATRSSFEVPGALDEVVARLLQKNPEDRFDSMAAVGDALKQILEELTDKSSTSMNSHTVAQPKVWTVVLTVTVFIIFIGVGTFVVILKTQKGDNSAKPKFRPSTVIENPTKEDGLRGGILNLTGMANDNALMQFSGRKDLTEVRLSYSEVTDKAVGYLTQSKLKKLNLAATKIKSLEHIPQFSLTLTELDLSSDDIGDEQLSKLASLRMLQTLKLNDTKITDTGLRSLANIKSLVNLDLSGTNVRSLESIPLIENLQGVDLARCRIGDTSLKHFIGMPMVSTLDLTGTRVTHASYDTIRRMPGLDMVILNDTKVSRQTIAKLQKELPSCIFVPQGNSLLGDIGKNADAAEKAGKFQEALALNERCLREVIKASGTNTPPASRYQLKVARCLNNLTRTEEAMEACVRAMKYARVCGHKTMLTGAISLYASMLAKKGQFRESLRLRNEEIRILQQLNPLEACRLQGIKINECATVMSPKEIGDVFAELDKQRELLESDSLLYAGLTSAKAEFELLYGSRKLAQKLARQSVDLLASLPVEAPTVASDVCFRALRIALETGQNEEAEEYIILFQKNSAKSRTKYPHMTLPLHELLLKHKQFRKVKDFSLELIPVSKDKNDLKAYAFIHLARAESGLRNYDRSIAAAEEAISIIKRANLENSMHMELIVCHQILANCYFMKGNLPKSLNQHEQARDTAVRHRLSNLAEQSQNSITEVKRIMQKPTRKEAQSMTNK